MWRAPFAEQMIFSEFKLPFLESFAEALKQQMMETMWKIFLKAFQEEAKQLEHY